MILCAKNTISDQRAIRNRNIGKYVVRGSAYKAMWALHILLPSSSGQSDAERNAWKLIFYHPTSQSRCKSKSLSGGIDYGCAPMSTSISMNTRCREGDTIFFILTIKPRCVIRLQRSSYAPWRLLIIGTHIKVIEIDDTSISQAVHHDTVHQISHEQSGAVGLTTGQPWPMTPRGMSGRPYHITTQYHFYPVM